MIKPVVELAAIQAELAQYNVNIADDADMDQMKHVAKLLNAYCVLKHRYKNFVLAHNR